MARHVADDSSERSTHRALRLTMEGRLGPVHLDLPDDVLMREAAGLPKPNANLAWGDELVERGHAGGRGWEKGRPTDDEAVVISGFRDTMRVYQGGWCRDEMV